MSKKPAHDDRLYATVRELEDKPAFTPTNIIAWILVPGALGMAFSVLMSRLLPPLIMQTSVGVQLDAVIERALKSLDDELALLADMRWSETSLDSVLLFGFLLGVTVRYFFRDKRRM